jgi:uncharacterized protein (DUF488 family)
MDRLFTIGAHGFDAEGFFEALNGAGIDLFLDLRRRRGMRGRLYAFANSLRLQAALEVQGIAYRHVIALAPEPATRELQRRADASEGTATRQRTALGGAFVEDYTLRTLDRFAWESLEFDVQSHHRRALFCVERLPEACHRGLVAARLSQRTGIEVEDLTP